MENAITKDADKHKNVFWQQKRLKGTNKDFSRETIINWNKARKYVLNVLQEKEKH